MILLERLVPGEGVLRERVGLDDGRHSTRGLCDRSWRLNRDQQSHKPKLLLPTPFPLLEPHLHRIPTIRIPVLNNPVSIPKPDEINLELDHLDDIACVEIVELDLHPVLGEFQRERVIEHGVGLEVVLEAPHACVEDVTDIEDSLELEDDLVTKRMEPAQPRPTDLSCIRLR